MEPWTDVNVEWTTNSLHQHLFGPPTTLLLARKLETPVEFLDSLLILSGFGKRNLFSKILDFGVLNNER